MARLPVSGADEDIWGNILNEFLSVEHSADGTLKARQTFSISNPAASTALGVNSVGQGGAFVSTANSVTSQHALTAYKSGPGDRGNSALNVVSDNTQMSAMQVTGIEVDRGTVKIAHKGQADGSDASAAAVSIDLQTTQGGSNGTAAQGIFVTSTTGQTTGNLLTLRNNGVDDFVVKGSGRVGVGIGIGTTPGARIEAAQRDDTTVGLILNAYSTTSSDLIQFKNSSGQVRTNVDRLGNFVCRQTMYASIGVQVGATSTDFGGGSGVLGMKDAATVPTGNPTGGVIVYAESGILKWRDPSGTIWPLNTTGSGWGAPSYNGFAAAAFDPAAAVNTSVVTAGVLYLIRIVLASAAMITKLAAFTTNTPTLTAGQNFAGLYNASGVLVASTGDMTTAWGAAGSQLMSLSASYSATAGTYYVAILANGSSPPSFSRSTGTAIGNINLAAGNYRFATFGTSQTALPASFTPASMGNSALAFWAGVI